jgi:glucan phosphoethanolaminetransferase (alkaline phosphatase superfamily)
MTSANGPAGHAREPGLTLDAGRLWPDGIATAVVAALIALCGVVVCRWLLDIALLAPSRAGASGDMHTTAVVLAAAASAIIATALLHVLLVSTPRPVAIFTCIAGLATLLAVLFPFATTAPLTAKIATAVVDLVLGIAIGSLLGSVAARSLTPRRAWEARLPADPLHDSTITIGEL